MIKISNSNLDKLCSNHYELLCNKFSFSIYKRLNKSLKDYKIKRKQVYKDYLLLLQFIDTNLKDIITAKPSKLEYYKNKMSKLSINFEFTKKKENKTTEQKEILIDLNKIFNYETFSSNGFTKSKTKTDNNDYFYSGNVLVHSLKLSVCPYCNRNTIYSIQDGEKRTSELDHFYPQSKYPFLALSFYNLVPSCKVCNKIKLDNDDKEYINPYDDRYDMNKNMKFSMKIKDSTFYNCEDGFKLEYIINNKISKDESNRIENNIEDFKLDDLYENHKDIVLELIQKDIVYNDSYIDELLLKYEGTLFKNKEDVQRLITCGYVSDEDLHKRPLSKLIKDISEELQII